MAHVLTGFGVNSRRGPKVAGEKVQEIRTSVYQLVCAYRHGEPVEDRIRSVHGSLAYLRATNPGLVARLERQISDAGIPFRGLRRLQPRSGVPEIVCRGGTPLSGCYSSEQNRTRVTCGGYGRTKAPRRKSA
jgi:hypothetical protein